MNEFTEQKKEEQPAKLELINLADVTKRLEEIERQKGPVPKPKKKTRMEEEIELIDDIAKGMSNNGWPLNKVHPVQIVLFCKLEDLRFRGKNVTVPRIKKIFEHLLPLGTKNVIIGDFLIYREILGPFDLYYFIPQKLKESDLDKNAAILAIQERLSMNYNSEGLETRGVRNDGTPPLPDYDYINSLWAESELGIGILEI